MVKHYIPRTARGSRKKDRLDAKRYERHSNNGRLDPIGRAYRHFSSWNKKHYGITKTDYGKEYWKTVKYGMNNAEEILLLKMTQQ